MSMDLEGMSAEMGEKGDSGAGRIWVWDDVGGSVARGMKESKLAGDLDVSLVLGGGCEYSGISGRLTTASTKRRSKERLWPRPLCIPRLGRFPSMCRKFP